jgi:hypothetical protein
MSVTLDDFTDQSDWDDAYWDSIRWEANDDFVPTADDERAAALMFGLRDLTNDELAELAAFGTV